MYTVTVSAYEIPRVTTRVKRGKTTQRRCDTAWRPLALVFHGDCPAPCVLLPRFKYRYRMFVLGNPLALALTSATGSLDLCQFVIAVGRTTIHWFTNRQDTSWSEHYPEIEIKAGPGTRTVAVLGVHRVVELSQCGFVPTAQDRQWIRYHVEQAKHDILALLRNGPYHDPLVQTLREVELEEWDPLPAWPNIVED